MAGGQETDTRKDTSSASNVADAKNPDGFEESDVKKLALWNSQTLSPIMSHRQLQPILAKHGFKPGRILADGGVSWRTYTYTAHSGWMAKLKNQTEEPPVVKLPYPVIDGLHEMTYQAFFEALDFYLDLGAGIAESLHVKRTEAARGDTGREWTIQHSGDGRKPPYKYTQATTLDVATLELILRNHHINNLQDQNLGNDDDDDDDHHDDDEDGYDYGEIDDDDVDAITRWKTRRTSGSSSSVNVPLKDIITLPKDQ